MLLPSQESKAFCFEGVRGIRQGLEVTGVGIEGYSAQNLCFAVCCSRCMCGEKLGGDLQWNFRTQRVSIGVVFLAKTLRFGTT